MIIILFFQYKINNICKNIINVKIFFYAEKEIKMKALIAPSWYPTEDNPVKGIFFKEQAEALHRHGIDVRVVFVNFISLKELFKSRVKTGLSQSMENGIKVYRYNTYNLFPKLYDISVRYYNYTMGKAFRAAISDGWFPQILHVHSVIRAGFAAEVLSKKYKIPYVITEHSSIFGRKLLAKQYVNLVKSAFSSSSCVIAVSESLKRDLSKFIDNDSIQVIPNICPFNFKENVSIDIHNSADKNKFTLFSLALLDRNKGMDILIKAFASKFKGDMKIALRIGGDGQEYNNLKDLIKKSGLENQVFLLGSLDRSEVEDEMKKCSCFILASRHETFGVVLIEALSFGKPVIATRCGGPEEIVNSSNGVLVNTDDAEGLSQAMVYMRDNIDTYHSDSIIKCCREKFGEDTVIRMIDKIYHKIL